MTLIESLLHPEMMFALGLFAILSILVEVFAYKLLIVVSEVDATSWLMSHLFIPAARAFALVAFILVAYPVIFGMDSALPAGELLAAGKMRLTHLVNVVFFLSLLLPLIPVFSRWPALVLPIQAIAAATMMFRWWADTQPVVDIQYWPGWTVTATMLAIAFITHEIAKQVSHQLEKYVDVVLEREGSGKLIYRTVVMFMQVPVILMYTLSLGKQFQ